MRDGRKIRYMADFILLGVGVLVFLILNCCIGSVKVPMADIISAVKGNEIENSRILWDIRLPRAFAAMILGGALALAGYLLQSFFHNPIAGPFVLGISSGAKMVVAIVMVFLMGQAVSVSSAVLIIAAFIGAMISMGFVLLMSKRVNNMSMLVVSGVMIGYICSAITEFIVTFANDADIVNLHNWSRGSFSGMTWNQVAVMAVVIAVTSIAVFMLAKPLSAYELGEAYARNMGVNVRLLRVMLVILSSLLSACIVAFAGPISFVGIAAPHLVKSILKTTKPILMIPACFLRKPFLYVLRFAGKDTSGTNRAQYKHSDCSVWSTGCPVGYDKAQ